MMRLVPTADQISSTLQLFRRELDKNMSNRSSSPGHEAMTVALHMLFKDMAAAPAASGDELVARLREEASVGRIELAKLPLELPQADIFQLAMGNLFDLMDEAAAALCARSEWIAVSERLPDDDCDQLVTDGHFITIAHHDDEWDGMGPMKITHWQPLPAPPK